RFEKPFALMARDLAVVRCYAQVTAEEAAALQGCAAPILLLDRLDPPNGPALANAVAPAQNRLGFMLPYSPLHHLLLADWDRPLVMTSGNLSEEPQCLDNRDAADRLHGLADGFLLHDREIVNRLDDSVACRIAGAVRVLRRARGFAPAPLLLPEGFEKSPAVLALGGELKATLCLLQNGTATLSQHLGDLEDARTAAEYDHTLALYRSLFDHHPAVLAADLHPDYYSTRVGQAESRRSGLPLLRIQHHHAHIAACLAENRWPRQAPPVLGVVLDGLGLGEDGSIWGCEWLVADYSGFRRVGRLRPVPLPGGIQAIREPWRNTLAHLVTAFGWDGWQPLCAGLPMGEWLARQPLDLLRVAMARGLNSPWSSSGGRLFDAVAALLGVRPASVSYEGQAAIELEALADAGKAEAKTPYPFAIHPGEIWTLDPSPLWSALLDDLRQGCEIPDMARAFHTGLAAALADMALNLAKQEGLNTVALSGGVMQNRRLFEALEQHLTAAGLTVLSHRQVPANDGGLALGQALVAAARMGVR
ncbi:MAG: Sua5/YciO/YrdC/YwlC family protein, partial [Pseudomonadota bacterium]